MNRKEAEDYIYQSYLKAAAHHEYQERDKDRRKPELTAGLIRQRATFSTVLVTGSKGKGSVANMISCMLQTRYKVGLMTSPHILDFLERFRVDGVQISDTDFIRIIEKIKPELDQIQEGLPKDACISPMGIQALAALEYFAEQGVDVGVFECGKGVQYDDVGNIPHEYAVINRILLEHTRELGATLEEIAYDKAHIITKDTKCVYVAEQEPEVIQVIRKRAEEFHVPVKQYGIHFAAENIRYEKQGMHLDLQIDGTNYRDFSIPLMGKHQAENCALAFAVCRDIFTEKAFEITAGKLSEDEKEIYKKISTKTIADHDLEQLKTSLRNINWPGRAELISIDPVTILDACINAGSCGHLIEILQQLQMKKVTMIIGIPDDKDYLGVARKMQPYAGQVILTKSHNPHYRFTELQKDTLEKEGIQAIWTQSVEEALGLAESIGQPTLILGTTSVVAEVKLLKK